LLVTRNEKSEYNPPKYDIANGFAFGHIPQTISFFERNGMNIMSDKLMLRET
jgi:hypothetical protein